MREIAVIGLRGFPGVQGGVEVHCENLYPHFSEDSKLRVYRRKPYLTSYSDKEYNNISFVDLPSTRVKGLEAVLHTFLSCCHAIVHRPDAVHVHNIGPGMFTPLLKLFGLRVTITYHSANYEHNKWGFVAKNILKFSEWLSLNFADNVIFVNKFQMEKVGTKYKDKCLYIANGVNSVTRSIATDFLEKNGLTSGEYVLAVGRITPEKGFDILVDAMSKCKEATTLVIAGASDHDKKYFEYIKSLDVFKKVVFTGFTTGEDLRQLYSHARVFVLSSFNEGFPIVLLEAMGYGLPLVVSDIPATHLVNLPERDYVECGNADELAEVLDLKWHDGVKKVEYNLSEFDWNLIALRTEQIVKGK